MKYHCVETCGNTFLLFDCLSTQKIDLDFAHKRLQKEERDDALILRKVSEDPFILEMIVLGLDGKIGEFCGNGSLATAAYLFKHYNSLSFFLKTKRGIHELSKHEKDHYSIHLPKVSFEINSDFIKDPSLLNEELIYAECGEPHLLIQRKMGDDELIDLARELNAQHHLFPLGINVNAWHELSPGILYVKTYERGVQRLTRSCGSGSICSAFFYQKQGKVVVETPGGVLEILLGLDSVELKAKCLI